MHKRVAIIVLLILLLTNINVLAGDIPEHIMTGNQKALFIGRITNIDKETFSIAPTTVMMGSIEEPEIKIKKFPKYHGTDDKLRRGDILVVVLEEDDTIDNFWVFKCTSEDYRTLKLISKRYNMVIRYEKYINEGKYFDAQKKIEKKQR